MGSFIDLAADKFAGTLPLGGTSPLIMADASRTAAISSAPISADIAGRYVDLSCLEGFLIDDMQAEKALTSNTLYQLAYESGFISPDDLLYPVERLSAEKLLPLRGLSGVSEVVSQLRSAGDAKNFMLVTLYQTKVKMSAVSALLSGVHNKLETKFGGDPQELTKLVQDFEAGHYCDIFEIANDVAQQDIMSVGGSGAALYVSSTETSNSGSNPEDYIDNEGWEAFTASRPGAHYVTVELLDSDMRPTAITKSGGAIVKGLRLQMSPETLAINSVKVINRYQTLTSWVEEHWGDEMDQLTFSGKSLGFISTVNGRKLLAIDSRSSSAAYKEMKKLISIVKSNGLVIQGASVGDPSRAVREFYSPNSTTPVRKIISHPRAGMVKERMYVKITFDFVSCIGYFESFEVAESASNPFLVSYNISFRSEMTRYLTKQNQRRVSDIANTPALTITSGASQ